MKHNDFTGILPEQTLGKEIEAEASAELHNVSEAVIFYDEVKERLLYVNNWHKTAGFVSGHFQITNDQGKELERKAQKGDYIRVDIPGPGSTEGDGYDWVCIEEMKEVSDENMQSIAFRVRPSKNPLGSKNETAHFYADEATSSFIVTREGKTVTASIIDRNLKPNDETEFLTDQVRHIAVGLGAIGAFSKAQWQSLAEGLIARKS